VARSFATMDQLVDGVIVTDLITPDQTCEAAIEYFGIERVLVPALLRMRMRRGAEAPS
jgi:hypothetical protein